ncbi:hypothetical protein [Mesorhizobium sp.]|uniref:hypothetical protein n=1 Tax=Mesorhizobium sp. TaxID=1871066 RepID=UPI00338EAD7B
MLTKEQDYFWVRPALVAAKQRQLALMAGAPNERGAAYAYNVKELRNREKAAAENASVPTS